MEQFLENIKDLEVTTVARAQEALDNKETATFFVGRKTCPYCRNSEEPSQLDALQDFRSRYEIPTVPGFVHVENGEIKVRCDSSMTAQEIKDFAGL